MSTTAPLSSKLDPELALLGSVLLTPDWLVTIAARVSPDDFSSERAAATWRAMLAAGASGKPLDLIVLRAELEAQGELQVAGGTAALMELCDCVPSSAHIEHYAEIVASRSTGRAVHRSATDAIMRIGAGENPYDVRADLASSLQAGARPDDGETLMPEAVDAMLADIDAEEDGLLPGLPTGIAECDSVLGGYRAGRLYLVAAGTGGGKTALALLAVLSSLEAGIPVYVASLEMKASALAQRLAAMRSGVSTQPSQWREGDRELFRAAAAWLRDQPLIVCETAELSRITAGARSAIKTQGAGLVVVDYAQKVRVEGAGYRDRHREVGAVSWELKSLAMQCNVPVILPSQLNREGKKSEQRPQMHHLYESGQLENDADVVILLWFPEGREGFAPKGEACIAKNRDGGQALIPVEFLQSSALWRAPMHSGSSASPWSHSGATSDPEQLDEEYGL